MLNYQMRLKSVIWEDKHRNSDAIVVTKGMEESPRSAGTARGRSVHCGYSRLCTK